MENMSQGLEIMGAGLAAVFGLMICISVYIWATGRIFVSVEKRVKERKKAAASSK